MMSGMSTVTPFLVLYNDKSLLLRETEKLLVSSNAGVLKTLPGVPNHKQCTGFETSFPPRSAQPLFVTWPSWEELISI